MTNGEIVFFLQLANVHLDDPAAKTTVMMYNLPAEHDCFQVNDH